MITVWKNDIARYVGEPFPGLTTGELVRVTGGDYTHDSAELVIVELVDADPHAWHPTWDVPEESLELVESAFCNCNFCRGDGKHPECPHNRPQVREAL